MKTKTLTSPPRFPRSALVPALVALAVVLTVQTTLMPQVIRKAGNIPETYEGMGKFLAACDQLEILSKVALIGVVPLCVFVGLGMMAFGAKNAVQKAALPVAALMALLMVPGVIA